MINKAYKCRIYPNKRQIKEFEQTFAACRFVYNLALEIKKASWEVNKKNLSYFDLSKMIPRWRKVAPWIGEVPQVALSNALRDLDRAYQNFFRRVKNGEKPGYPKFKSRYNSEQSFRVNYSKTDKTKNIVLDEHHVRLVKIGPVKVRGLQEVEGRILNATVRRVPSGKYFLSLCCTDVPEPEMPKGEGVIGIDAGLHDLMVRSDGVRVENNKYLRKSEKKLRREQRRLARKQKGSKNYQKQRVKVARVHERIANQRRDAIHKATTGVVRDAEAIAVEDLNVKGMAKNHHLAKSVHDASMSEMTRQLQYKCEWYGRDFVKVDRFYPSTQVCNHCGSQTGPRGKGELGVREWVCPECGAINDRDLNAAMNIRDEGERILVGGGS